MDCNLQDETKIFLGAFVEPDFSSLLLLQTY